MNIDSEVLEITIGPPPTWGGGLWFDGPDLRVALGNGCCVSVPKLGISITSGDTTDFYALIKQAGKSKQRILPIFWRFLFGWFQDHPSEFQKYVQRYWRAMWHQKMLELSEKEV